MCPREPEQTVRAHSHARKPLSWWAVRPTPCSVLPCEDSLLKLHNGPNGCCTAVGRVNYSVQNPPQPFCALRCRSALVSRWLTRCSLAHSFHLCSHFLLCRGPGVWLGLRTCDDFQKVRNTGQGGADRSGNKQKEDCSRARSSGRLYCMQTLCRCHVSTILVSPSSIANVWMRARNTKNSFGWWAVLWIKRKSAKVILDFYFYLFILYFRRQVPYKIADIQLYKKERKQEDTTYRIQFIKKYEDFCANVVLCSK